MDYDTKFFSCIWTKERLYLLIQFQCDNFHIDQCIIKQMKRLKTFANWTPFVPWLEFFYDSHVIIQALNTNSLQQHYQDIDHNHNLRVSCILCILKNKNTIVKWYTKIRYIKIFLYLNLWWTWFEHLYNTQMLLDSYDTIMCNGYEYITITFHIKNSKSNSYHVFIKVTLV